ncbi:unnamed protein product [Diamesa serratosioi]
MHFECQIEEHITGCENTQEDAIDWRMNFLGVSPSDSLFAVFDNINLTDLMEYTEAPWSPEIRMHDCMWSGICVDLSHPNKKKPITSEFNSTVGQQQPHPVHEPQETTRGQMSELLSKRSSPRQIMTYNYVRATMTKDSVRAGESLLRKILPTRATNNHILQTNQVNLCADVCTSMTNLCIADGLSINFINKHSDNEEKQHKRHLCFLGVQTPSDSDKVKEILPTNPSVEDCRTLQVALAAKMTGINPIKKTPLRHTKSMNKPTFSSFCKTKSKSIEFKTELEFVSKSKRKRHNSFDDDFEPEKPLAKKRRPPLKKKTNLSCVDADFDHKRNLHNILERQRRIGLQNLFEQLRNLIPKLSQLKRVSKKRILKEAAYYCLQLKLEDSLRTHLIIENNRLLKKIRMINARPIGRKQLI